MVWAKANLRAYGLWVTGIALDFLRDLLWVTHNRMGDEGIALQTNLLILYVTYLCEHSCGGVVEAWIRKGRRTDSCERHIQFHYKDSSKESCLRQSNRLSWSNWLAACTDSLGSMSFSPPGIPSTTVISGIITSPKETRESGGYACKLEDSTSRSIPAMASISIQLRHQ